jgi:hypothetical protein
MSPLRVGVVGGGPTIEAIRTRLRDSVLDIEVTQQATVGYFDTASDCWDDEARSHVLVTSAPPPADNYLGLAAHRHPNLFYAGAPTSWPRAVAGYLGAAIEELALAGASRVQVRHPIERSWLGYVRATGGTRKLARKLKRFDADDFDYTCASTRDEDVYDGPVVIAHDDDAITTRMRVQGYFDPLDGHFHWAGIAFGDQVRDLKDRRVASVEVAVGDGDPVPARLTDITPWGSVRITGVGRPPYPLDDIDILMPNRSSVNSGRAPSP